MKIRYLFALFFVTVIGPLAAQSTFCPDDPPVNSFLADSPWPIYHRNNYAQSSTCIRGPMPADSLVITARTRITGGTSPWVYLSEKYPNGERVLLYSNSTHVFKLIDDGSEIFAADSLRIDFDPITSFGWNFLLSKDKIWYTYDPKYDPEEGRFTRLFKLTDSDITDPYSEIIVLDTFDFGDYGINRVQAFSLNYDGHIVFNSENNPDLGYAIIGVIGQGFTLLDTLQYATLPDEIVHHNAFPIDENNSCYVVTTHRLIKFGWDGSRLFLDWEAPYDFVADGPTGSFAEGSGTTPTLVGWGAGNDKLVVVADGHARNNLVAFWRELPSGWAGVPGMDIHFADSIRIPRAESFSNIFQSIENSPTAYGYDIGIAQFNGFLGYDCSNLKGVQKISWDTAGNHFRLAWVNEEVNMNGVLTYSAGSNLLYGSGKEDDCNYYYYGLDWNTGEVALRLLLGPEGTFTDDPFYDAGNNNIIDENGNIYFPGGSSLVKIEAIERATGTTEVLPAGNSFTAYPNPAGDYLNLPFPDIQKRELTLYGLSGRVVTGWDVENGRLHVGGLERGVYFIRFSGKEGVKTGKFIKQ